MNGTVKTVLIVGGVAVGVVVLVKMLGPSAIAPQSKAPTDRISLNGLIGLGSALGGLFGSKGGTSAPAVVDSASGLMATREEWTNVAAYDAQGTPGAPVFGIAGLDY